MKKGLSTNRRKSFDFKVPEVGLEPTRVLPHWILNLAVNNSKMHKTTCFID
jgi:hypothetical protein